MADIELVINISEESYKNIKKQVDKRDYPDMQIGRNIADGTPLPKGHGRLGDLDALRKEVLSWGINDYDSFDFINEIDWADTIIEADKENENEKRKPCINKVIHLEKYHLPHNVAEVICLKCLKRWVAVYPEKTLLKDIECTCGEVGYVIKTGQELFNEDN